MERNFELGEVISWREPDKNQRTIAAMSGDENLYQAAIHHKGDSQVNSDTFEMWYCDEIPQEAQNIRRADKDEILEFVWALIENSNEFRVTASHMVVLADCDTIETTDEIQRWHMYLTSLVGDYAYRKTLSSNGDLKRWHHVGGLTKEQFYRFGLDKKKSADIDIPFTCRVINMVKQEKKR